MRDRIALIPGTGMREGELNKAMYQNTEESNARKAAMGYGR